MENIIVELNGIKYLLFECDLNNRTHLKFTQKVQKYRGIVQSMKIKSGLFIETIVTVKVLIPEINAISFSNPE